MSLIAPLWDAEVGVHLDPCEAHLRDLQLATSSYFISTLWTDGTCV
jgi:hypothetical protein